MRRPGSPALAQPELPALCRWLLPLARKALSSLLVLWRLTWHALLCCKVCWELVFHVVQEVSATRGSRLESCSDACDGGGARTPGPELGQPGAGLGVLQAQLQRLQEASSARQARLEGLEAEVRHVGSELRAEKFLWSSRYLELLREQQELRERLQAWGRRPWPQDPRAMLSDAEAPGAAGLAGWCTGESGRGVSLPAGELQARPASSCSGRAAATSALAPVSPRPGSAAAHTDSARLGRARQQPGPRASVPRSPRDLHLGQRAKVLLRPGGVGVGVVRHLGVCPDQAEVAVGLELEAPGQGVLTGHECFPCKPGHGALVPFSKVLLVWEQAPAPAPGPGPAGQPRWRDTGAGSEGPARALGWDHGAQEAPGRRARRD